MRENPFGIYRSPCCEVSNDKHLAVIKRGVTSIMYPATTKPEVSLVSNKEVKALGMQQVNQKRGIELRLF
jgi:hypothetical protein